MHTAPTIETSPAEARHDTGSNQRRQPMPRAVRFALAGNAAIRVAGPATAILLSTYYLPYINERHYPVSAFIVGALTAAFYATELTGSPLLGALGDRYGRRVFLLAGPLLGAVALGVMGLTTALALLLLARLLEGLSTAAAIPAVLSRLSEETDVDPALRGRVLSIFEVTTALGTLIGTAGASALWIALGRGSFLAIALCYLLATLIFSRLRPDAQSAYHRTRHHGWRDSLALVRQQHALLRFLPAWLALSAITGLWFTHALYQMRVVRPGFADQYLAGRFADWSAGLGLVVLSFAIVFSTGALLWGYVGLPRLHEVIVMRVALGAMLGVCAAIWLINHSGTHGLLRGMATVVYGLLVLVESGFAPAAVAYLARLSGRVSSDRGLVMGLYTVISGGGSLLAAALGAPFAQVGAIDGILLATVLLALGSLGLLSRLPTADARRADGA